MEWEYRIELFSSSSNRKQMTKAAAELTVLGKDGWEPVQIAPSSPYLVVLLRRSTG